MIKIREKEHNSFFSNNLNPIISSNNRNFNIFNMNNNSIIMNKSSTKLYLNKTGRKNNLRSISYSSKCVIKVKDKVKKDHNITSTSYAKSKKLNSFNKEKINLNVNINKILKNKEPQDNYRNRKKLKKQTPFNTTYNDIVNKSFNFFHKLQNPANNSLKKIDSSYNSEFPYNLNSHNSNLSKKSAKVKIKSSKIPKMTNSIQKNKIPPPEFPSPYP